MSKFDPDTFMQQTVDAPIADEYVLCPAGEYDAVIADFDSKAFRTNEFVYKQGQNAGLPGEMTTFNCPFVVNDPRVQQALGREQTTVYFPIILDFDDQGQLDTGTNKNVKLGQLRTAVGQKETKPWGIHMLRGQGPVKIRVNHRTIERKDGSKFDVAEVDRVVPIR